LKRHLWVGVYPSILGSSPPPQPVFPQA
jgi:hypothetical protein